jgi:carbon storage regulator
MKMLVLSRCVGERIVVGDGIVITLVAVHGNKARIGIEAPSHVPVDRQEVRDRKRAERDLVWDAELLVCQPW